MGKKAFLAFFLSLLVIIGYNYMMAQKYPPAPVRQGVLERPEEVLLARPEYSQAGGPAPAALEAQGRMRESYFAAGTASQARDFVVETDLVKLVITSSGARIKSCQLKGYPAEKIGAGAVQKQINEIDQAKERASSAQAKESLQRQKDKLEILLERAIQEPDMAELVSLPATIDADFSPAIVLPARQAYGQAGGPDNEAAASALNTALYHCADSALSLSKDTPAGQLAFSYSDPQGRRIEKVYSFSNSNYSIGLDISFQGWEREDFPLGHFLLSSGPDVGMPQAQRGRRMYGYQGPVSCFQSGQQSWAQKEKYARNEQGLFVRREHEQKGVILWTGLENKYFLSALIPSQPLAQSVVIEKNRFDEQKVALAVPWKGSGPAYSFRLYLGPKKEERLKEINATLEKSIDYGFFGPIARFMYQILVFFSRWTHNFGWAIVLLCLVTKIVFYPLTHHSFESMQKMQQQMKSIQPEMDALREKFRDNPQKINKEIMALYRKRGINPLASCQSGCLPMLLQMPVFFALYGILYNSIELRGAPFLGWVTDLSAKDPYYVLPVLMGVSMFMQQKLTGMGAGSGAQQEQAKMMGLLMPVFLTWIFASLPSGVVLYWFTFNVATALQQLLIRKRQKALSAA